MPVFAEIHGKLGTDYSRAHDRGEDLFTSTAFGLLRYLPDEFGLRALLRRARIARLTDGVLTVLAKPDWIDLPVPMTWTAEFWPSLGQYGEPDVLLKVHDAAGNLAHLILFEVKLYAPKGTKGGGDRIDPEPSSVDYDDDEASSRQDAGPILGSGERDMVAARARLVEAEEAFVPPDQLAKYWGGLCQNRWGNCDVPRSLIYVTPHASAPEADLSGSLEHSPVAMRLGWLSWRDVWRVASAAAQQGLPRPAGLVASDLAALLAYKGLSDFTGFRASATLPPGGFQYDAGFWQAGTPHRSGPWFGSSNAPLPVDGSRLWRAAVSHAHWFDLRPTRHLQTPPDGFWRRERADEHDD